MEETDHGCSRRLCALRRSYPPRGGGWGGGGGAACAGGKTPGEGVPAKAGEEAGLGKEGWEGVLDGGKGIEVFTANCSV